MKKGCFFIVDSFLYSQPHHTVRLDLADQRLRVLPIVLPVHYAPVVSNLSPCSTLLWFL